MEPYSDIIMEMLPGETPKAKHDNLKKMGELLFHAGWIPGWTKSDITRMIQGEFSRAEIEKISGDME